MGKQPEHESRRIAGFAAVSGKEATRVWRWRWRCAPPEEAGAQTEPIDPRDNGIIFCDGREDESQYPEDVFKLREALRRTQG
jgi:hypothetical protein